MKTSELIKLRFDVIHLLYAHGNHPDTKEMITKAREMINFITTGNVLKRPEVDKK